MDFQLSQNMDLISMQVPQLTIEANGNEEQKEKEKEKDPQANVSMVELFLVEALQNPRHRFTILRMELDIQKFLRNSDRQQFEFPHFPTSYLRLAAHRVAQHYGLQTMVQDNVIDGQEIRILVVKKPESKVPVVCLSDVPARQLENDEGDRVKIVIKTRHSKAFSNEINGTGLKHCPVRTVEERKEDYDKARARIFSSRSSSGSEDAFSHVASNVNNLNVDESEVSRNLGVDEDKRSSSRDIGSSSRVAIFRNREKDITDPDYDRCYERYVKNIPSTQHFSLAPSNMQKFQPPFVHYDPVFPQLSQRPVAQVPVNYQTPIIYPYCAMGSNQTSRDVLYMQWPSQSMMYAWSYDQQRHAFCQVPFCQQPLSFDYSQKHR